ncbi:MAG: preprotein translocase subunit SecA, partial [Candidatus Bipolaricaulia bacterium]
MVVDRFKRAVDRLFGQTNKQKLKRLRPYLEQVNALEDQVQSLADDALRAKTDEFRERLVEGETPDELLPEAFAIVREVARRQVKMRPFDVQILGAVVLHQGGIAEMATGEGKTLVATLPAYLNALVGNVHVVTVNDYLARRDRDWMGPIYESLGLKVGLLQEGIGPEARRDAYQADIVYGTNNQFGFDYLRDNMATLSEGKVQTSLDYAIIDEIDNILIDEARTPLIISGSTSESAKRYKQFASLAHRFKKDLDFEIDEKARRVQLTEAGVAKAEGMLRVDNLYAPEHVELLHHFDVALRAKWLFHKDRDYLVKDGRVVIIDEFTGRLMEDRRYSDGLHQALEAKEGMQIRRESQTLAQITLQHYFKLYDGIAGMTGTAATEEEEFKEIYGLGVVVIPTNRPLIRDSFPDVIFRTEAGKYQAIVGEIEALHRVGRPVLVGTTSVEDSERLSQMLDEQGLKHNVLNAKYHEQEAEIIKDAGQGGAITIATNMAGRGTDIQLGERIAELGGLHVIGAQRHESRRIDNQLHGRAGRQGDPGSSQFFVSLQDDLIRLFGGDRIAGVMDRLGMKEGDRIEHDLLTRAVRRAQKKVEDRNFQIRKQLLQFDEVMAKQREAIYGLRDQFISGEADLENYLNGILESYAETLMGIYGAEERYPEEWDLEGLRTELTKFQNGRFEVDQLLELDYQSAVEALFDFLEENRHRQVERLGDAFEPVARWMILRIIDENWRLHLYALDDLQEGIGWRAYGGTDPLVEFKRESFNLFQEMLSRIGEEIVNYLIKPRLKIGTQADYAQDRDLDQELQYQHGTVDVMAETQTEAKRQVKQQPVRVPDEPGRNDPCPCDSGK